MSPLMIVRTPLSKAELQKIAEERFGDMVKAVVDCERHIMAIGGELHADEEQMLLDDGSQQQHIWGINLYPGEAADQWIEFDSMINLRPSQGNRSRSVDDVFVQEKIRTIVTSLIHTSDAAR